MPTPKPPRPAPQRKSTQPGMPAPVLGQAGAAKLGMTPSTTPAPMPRVEPTQAGPPPSEPDLPDAPTVLHDVELFTPPDIPLSLPRPPLPPNVEPAVQVARIVSINPPLPDPSAKADIEAEAELVPSKPPPQTYPMVRVPPTPQSFDAMVTSTSSAPPPALVRPRHDHRLVILNEPDSTRAASFRLLRDNLLTNKLPRVLAVSSSAPNAGKTTCAINLAFALGEQPPTRVLLIDGNFFDPTLGAIFSIDASTPAVHDTDVPWLAPYRIAEVARGVHVAAIVRKRGDPQPRFDSQWFDTLIGHLCGANYDHLIIDAAALEGSPSVMQLIAIADATLLTVRSGVTTARALRRAADQVPKSKAMGVALIDSPAKS